MPGDSFASLEQCCEFGAGLGQAEASVKRTGNSELSRERPALHSRSRTPVLPMALESPLELRSSTNSAHLRSLRSSRNNTCFPTSRSCLYTNCYSPRSLREHKALR